MVTRRALLRCVSAGTLAGLAGCSAVRSERPATADGTLRVAPETAPFDERLDVRVTGVAPDTEVTLTARTTDRDGRQWASFARFRPTDDGVVDPARQAPVEGTYDAASPMGLVWSMRPDDRAAFFAPPDDGSELTVTARTPAGRIGRRTVRRRVGPADVVVEEPPDGLVGTAFRPAGSGPFPGVLALHGSGGEPSVANALMLAANGYAAFAPQYFGAPDPLPDQLAEVPVEYVERCADWLGSLSAVRGDSVGLVGASKGAELALLAGATYDWVDAVVAYAPSGLVWAGLTYGGEVTSSWTLAGDPVPFVPTAFPPEVIGDYVGSWPLGEPVSLRPTYAKALETADRDAIEEATIPVEDIDGPVTLISGADDRLWPSARLARIAADRLEAADHPHAVRNLVYDGAGHAVSYPYQPTTGFAAAGEQLPGTPMAMGGTPEGYARAARESWPQVLATLEEGRS